VEVLRWTSEVEKKAGSVLNGASKLVWINTNPCRARVCDELEGGSVEAAPLELVRLLHELRSLFVVSVARERTRDPDDDEVGHLVRGATLA
jgi:hypothetical protein